MKLSKELYESGILGHQRTSSTTHYRFVGREGPRLSNHRGSVVGSDRIEASTKVSQKGWRILSNVLRLQ